VAVTARDYPPRIVTLPEAKTALALDPGAVRESRELLRYLRTLSRERLGRPPFVSPVEAAPVYSFGSPTSYPGAALVETLTDGIYGEYHRGMDYEVAEGTPVVAPADGLVLLARDLPLGGRTLVVDHGQGVVSAFFHLSQIDVPEGRAVAAGAPLARSGSTGAAANPHLHWGVYLHGIAVDPRIFQSLTE
jgi:murein DD-endopeptidase MepM/ murein hydrolase activator NlpD